MTQPRKRRASDTKDRLVNAIVRARSDRKTPFSRSRDSAQLFVANYDNVAVEDLRAAAPSALAAAAPRAPGTRRNAQARSAQGPDIQPVARARRLESTHTIIEVVNDDMPFLVDSIGIAIDRAGLGLASDRTPADSTDTHTSRQGREAGGYRRQRRGRRVVHSLRDRPDQLQNRPSRGSRRKSRRRSATCASQ